MDGVLSRTLSGRPRVTAVGALLALCLAGAPLMSLLLAVLWELNRALDPGGTGQGALLVAPVAVGSVVVLVLLATYWLRRSGVTRPAACACLVAGTAMATPLVLGLLAPAFAPVPGGTLVNSAVVSALVTTGALGVCVLVGKDPRRRQPGVVPGVAVVAAALLLLPSASEFLRGKSTDERSLAQINEFRDTIAVLDHPSWAPVRVHEVHGGLRMTYTAHTEPEGEGRPGAAAPGTDPLVRAGAAGPGFGSDNAEDVRTGALHVLSWSPDRTSEGIHSGCDFPGVECSDSNSLLVVHRGVGSRNGARLDEVRTRLDDGAVASVHPVGALSPELLFAVAQTLRAEKPGERDTLIRAVIES